ncbi:MAG: GGDEF domain-containing protein, partial [Marinirhabdus sp.]|nr:GGDEF domain-containing protein [Marinirhabdus sp.]
ASIAISDPLTGIMNRRGFIENAERLISLSKRSGKTACLMILDIDHFKTINDRYGHKVGDFCLIEFSEIIQSCCRLHDLVARIGGEEFIILLDNCSSDMAREKANYLIKRIREYKFQPNGVDQAIQLTVSVGIAELEQSLQHAWQCADEALYSVKNSGRNGVQIYLPTT